MRPTRRLQDGVGSTTEPGTAARESRCTAPTVSTACPELPLLVDLLPEGWLHLADCEPVAADEMPEPYRGLLAHHHHMTVVLERHHGAPVELVVGSSDLRDDLYSRGILLTAGPTRKVVMLGSVRFQISRCTQMVRREILEEKLPLGRILIAHCALRRIEPHGYVRIRLRKPTRDVFGAPASALQTYGRLAVITCHHEPVVELLEIVAPDGADAAIRGSPSGDRTP